MTSNATNPLFQELVQEIMEHPDNAYFSKLGLQPLFTASSTAKILIIGQAPGKRAQESGIAWNDASGKRLINWLGITESVFRDPALISHLPMDFYYPGKGKSGDLPPRKHFADLWHTKIIQHMPQLELTLLVGQYSQKYYLGKTRNYSLTETVRNYGQYLPTYLPLVHPSPLNFRWLQKNSWYEEDVIPALQARVREIL